MSESTSPQKHEGRKHITTTPEAVASSLRRIASSLEFENYKLTEGQDNPHITAASIALNHVMVAIIKEVIYLKED